MPLGAVITTDEIAQVFRIPGAEFRSGSTFGGHTTACATTLANIDIIEKEGLAAKAAEDGKYLKSHFDQLAEKCPIIGDIRGIGMLWAIELVADRKTNTPLDTKLAVGTWIRDYCWQREMILRNNGDILVIAPALVITREQIDFMLNLVEEAIAGAMKHFKL